MLDHGVYTGYLLSWTGSLPFCIFHPISIAIYIEASQCKHGQPLILRPARKFRDSLRNDVTPDLFFSWDKFFGQPAMVASIRTIPLAMLMDYPPFIDVPVKKCPGFPGHVLQLGTKHSQHGVGPKEGTEWHAHVVQQLQHLELAAMRILGTDFRHLRLAQKMLRCCSCCSPTSTGLSSCSPIKITIGGSPPFSEASLN